MAQKQIVQVTDDLDGEQLEPDDIAEVRFALDGTAYVIDLSKANAFLLRSTLQRYTDAGRPDQPRTRTTRAASPGSSSRKDLNQVREWANSNGHTVSNRGRVPASVLDAYDQAH